MDAKTTPQGVVIASEFAYSLRHTALCMRMVLSDGTVNMEVLARNAGTSQDMLTQFYLKYLPMTRELARNLQSFGGKE